MKLDDTRQWELDLAVTLGYDVSPTNACILLMHPFAFEGDEVIARQIVPNEHGGAILQADGTVFVKSVRHPVPEGFERPC